MGNIHNPFTHETDDDAKRTAATLGAWASKRAIQRDTRYDPQLQKLLISRGDQTPDRRRLRRELCRIWRDAWTRQDEHDAESEARADAASY